MRLNCVLIIMYVDKLIHVQAIPRRSRSDTVYVEKGNGYLPFSRVLNVRIDQIQDFICPEEEDMSLYLVPETSSTVLRKCDINQQQLLYHCNPYRYSKFTLYYSTMTPSGWLEFSSGSKYWIVSSDCTVQIKIYVW